MKKNFSLALFTIAIIFTACQPLTNAPRSLGGSNGDDTIEPILTKYSGTGGSVKYTLVVTHIPARTVVKGDDYELTFESGNTKKTSTGKIEAVDGNNLTLRPGYENAKSFTMGFDGTTITRIDGTITFDNGTTQTGPGAFVSSAEDSKSNEDGDKSGDNKGNDSKSPTVTSVTVSPSTATVAKGGAQQFSATISGSNNPAQTVTWTLTGGASGTTISSSGLLTVSANQNPGTLTVRATSTVDTGKSGTATVTVPTPGTPPPAADVIVSPSSSTVPRSGYQRFNATAYGIYPPIQTFTWSVTGGTGGTSIDSNGFLTIGSTQNPGTLTVTATSTIDTSKSGTATVTVPASTPTVTSVTVSPSTETIGKERNRAFYATVNGTNYPPQTVKWEVTGGSSGTRIDSYTYTDNDCALLIVSDADNGKTLTVKATSTFDTSKSGTAKVTLDLNKGPATYTVSFNINGGTGATPSPQTVLWEETVTLPYGDGFSRAGYILVGWDSYPDASGHIWAPGTRLKTSTSTMYAVWAPVGITYTISYNLLGGTGTVPTTQTVTSGNSITLPDSSGFSKTGYTFGGWILDNTSYGILPAGWTYTPIGNNSNITFFAYWRN